MGIEDNTTKRGGIGVGGERVIGRSAGNLIVDGAITTNKLSANAVTADKINASAVTTAKIATGAVTAGTIASGAITADKIAASAVTTDKLSVGNGGNLYATGYDTFENIPNLANQIYYGKSSNATVSIDTSMAYYGTRCLKIVSAGSDSYVYLGGVSNGYGCIPVVQGKTYIISAWVKCSMTTTVQLYVVGHTGKNNTNSQHTGSTATIGASWTRIYLRYTATSAYPYISVRIDNDTNGATLWVDAIQIESGTTKQTPSEFSPAGTTVINGGRIITGTITANSIAASAITTDKLSANAVTAAKITSGAITTEKLAAGAVTAAKISVTDLSALKAKIGGWTIASTYIGNSQEGGSIYITSKSDNSPYWIRTHNAASGGGARTFSISKTGQLYAIAGEIAGWKITSKSLYADYDNGAGTLFRTYIQKPSAHTDWVFSTQISQDGGKSFDGRTYIRADGVTKVYQIDCIDTASFEKGLTVRNAGLEIYNSSAPYIDFHYGNSTADNTGRIANTSHGAFTVYNTISNASDRRLKKDIEEIDDKYIDVLEKLNPVQYRFIKGDEKLNLGFVAQDIEKALEESGIVDMPLVAKGPDGIYALDYNGIIPILVLGYQKQKQEIKRQKSKINYLENMVTHLIGIAMNPARVKTYQI